VILLSAGNATAQVTPPTKSQQPSAPVPFIPPGLPDAEGPVAKCLHEAHVKLMKEGPEKALDAFRECAKQFPDSPDAHFALGMCYFVARQPEEAAEELNRVIKLQPEHTAARAMLGKLYSFDDSKLSLAEELLKQVVKANPYFEDAIFDLGRVYAKRGDTEKALAHFARVLASEQRFALYHFELGRIMATAGALDKAKVEFQRALVLYPNFKAAEEELRKLGQKPGESPSPVPTPGQEPSSVGGQRK
jgi:tetratricopeptide (TPR) repeat protein